MERQLQDLRTQAGDPYHLVPLPLPKPIYDEEGQQLPANYANFLIINHAVMVPTYGDPMDEIALQRLADCFPQHEIIAYTLPAVSASIRQFALYDYAVS